MFISFISFTLHGQKKINSYWEFENFNILYFTDTVAFSDSGRIIYSECSSSICDSNGNLMFYTDGLKVWNKYHRIVKNSTNIGYPWFDIVNSSRQGVLLLRNDKDKIYLFNTERQARQGGLNYSVIEIGGNKDSGFVSTVRKNIVEYTNEAITAINHYNERDIWVISHSALENRFYTVLLKMDGSISCLNEQIIGPNNYSGSLDGQTNMKISPDGKYLARSIGQFSFLEFYQFNRTSGLFEYIKLIENNEGIAGIEFSENSKYLYYTKRDSSVIQYDIENNKKRVLKYLIDIFPGQLQLAPNGIIYLTIPYRNYLSGIINANSVSAFFKDSIIFLKGNIIESGLPNFNQSYFYNPSINFNYNMNCIKNSMELQGYDTFKASSHKWIIRNKGNAIEAIYSAKNINHTFSDTGKYEVSYFASNGVREDTVIKIITIYPKINKQFLGKDTFYGIGTSINKTLKAPLGMHCQIWQDSSGLTSFFTDTAGIYICKVTNKSFCEVTDTIVITECISSLTTPSLYRSRDTLYTYQPVADSFVWYRNNVQYRITKEPFIRLVDTGIYRVEAARNGYCNKSSITNHVNKLGISSFQLSDFNIQLFPNPSTEQVFIKADKNFILQISDVTGRIISVQENIESIYLPKGIYFFNFMVVEYRFTEKVIIL